MKVSTQNEIEDDIYSLDNIARDIYTLLNVTKEDTWRRLCLECVKPGYNVCEDVTKYQVTPHVYDIKMQEFYKSSYGFIFESLVESTNEYRKDKWRHIVKIIDQKCPGNPNDTSILVYGDAAGNDAMYLACLGYNVVYHDLESVCSEFAFKRFKIRNLSNIRRLKNDSEKSYDFVVCLEVAEHVQNPQSLLEELASYTKDTGYCLFSEAFSLVDDRYPTHLIENEKYSKEVDSLLERAGFTIYWRDIHDKPILLGRRKWKWSFLYKRPLFEWIKAVKKYF